MERQSTRRVMETVDAFRVIVLDTMHTSVQTRLQSLVLTRTSAARAEVSPTDGHGSMNGPATRNIVDPRFVNPTGDTTGTKVKAGEACGAQLLAFL